MINCFRNFATPPQVSLRQIGLLAATFAVCAVGCGKKQPVTPAEPTISSTQKEAPSENVEPVVTAAENVELEAESPQIQRPERILLLARGGPLILDVILLIDGAPYWQGVETLVDRTVAAGDTDRDGIATWDEWRQNEEFLSGELVEMNPIRQRTLRNWVERYDENDDGKLQRGEAAAWLGRDGGRSATGFRIRSRRRYDAGNASDSRLWATLDQDHDGRLSRQERLAMRQRLLELDTDDDYTIGLAELATLREQLESQQSMGARYRQSGQREAARWLRTAGDASELDYLLSDLYAPRQQIGPQSFFARAELFEELDSNEDRMLDAAELATLQTIDPHLRLAIDFDTGEQTSKLTLLEHGPQIDRLDSAGPGQLTLAAVDTRLTLYANDLRGDPGEQVAVAANEISLMIHDQGDLLFMTLDSNGDGRLGEREIDQAAACLSEVDNNGDQVLLPSELPYTMTLVFARGETRTQQSFYTPPNTTNDEPTETVPKWFNAADLNFDGDLSRREFLGTASQFALLDTNRDNFVDQQEAAAIGH